MAAAVRIGVVQDGDLSVSLAPLDEKNPGSRFQVTTPTPRSPRIRPCRRGRGHAQDVVCRGVEEAQGLFSVDVDPKDEQFTQCRIGIN